MEFDPEVLTGHIARVTAAINAAAAGAVAYTLEGPRHDVAAISLDGKAIQAGADVVIDRIKNGLAFVERGRLWKDGSSAARGWRGCCTLRGSSPLSYPRSCPLSSPGRA